MLKKPFTTMIFLFGVGAVTVLNASTKLTVYNNGGLFQSDKVYEIKGDIEEVDFGNISNTVDRDSVLVMGVDVYETKFENGINTRDLIKRSIGKTVSIYNKDGEHITMATLIGKNQRPVVMYNGKVWEIDDNKVVKYLGYEKGDFAKDNFVARIGGSGDEEISLVYLDRGLKWNAGYTAVIDAGKISLKGEINLENNGSEGYDGVELSVIGGKINMNWSPARHKIEGLDSVIYASRSHSRSAKLININAEAGNGYYKMDYARKIDIGAGSKKKLFMFNKANINFKKKLVINGRFGAGITNAIQSIVMGGEDNGVGRVMPSGKINVFERVDGGKLLFRGAGTVGNTNKNDKVEVKVGEDYMITGKFDYHKKSGPTNNIKIQHVGNIEIKNHSNRNETIKVKINKPYKYSGNDGFKYGRKKINVFEINGYLELDILVPANSNINGKLNYYIKK